MLFVAMFLAWSATCIAEMKVGVVDMQKAIFKTSDGQRAREKQELQLRSLVFGRSEDGVLFAVKEVDFTERIVREYDRS
jgi:hypothetical protein